MRRLSDIGEREAVTRLALFLLGRRWRCGGVA